MKGALKHDHSGNPSIFMDLLPQIQMPAVTSRRKVTGGRRSSRQTGSETGFHYLCPV